MRNEQIWNFPQPFEWNRIKETQKRNGKIDMGDTTQFGNGYREAIWLHYFYENRSRFSITIWLWLVWKACNLKCEEIWNLRWISRNFPFQCFRYAAHMVCSAADFEPHKLFDIYHKTVLNDKTEIIAVAIVSGNNDFTCNYC